MKLTIKAFFLIFFICSVACANEHFLAQVKRQDQFVSLFRDGKRFTMPIIIRPAEEKIILGLAPDEDVIIEGHVRMDKTVTDEGGNHMTTFVVDSVRPISLKKLSYTQDFKFEPASEPRPLPEGYEPMMIPVSSGVATALTLTASAALLSSLTAPTAGGALRNDINMSVLIGSGLLMTGAYLLDQIFSNNPKDNL